MRFGPTQSVEDGIPTQSVGTRLRARLTTSFSFSVAFFMLIVLPLSMGTPRAFAQGKQADYERAKELATKTRDKVFRTEVKPRWLEDNKAFWYRVRTAPGKQEYVLVDVEKGTRAPAFDHAKLAESLKAATGKDQSADSLPIERLEFSADRTSITFELDGQAWRWVLAESKLEKTAAPEPKPTTPGRPTPRASTRTGEETELLFVNRTKEAVELFWLDTEGEKHGYGSIEPGREHRQHTFAGHVWQVMSKDGRELLRIEAEEDSGRVVIDGQQPPAQAPQRDRPARRGRGSNSNSPDGRWAAFIENDNVRVRDTNANEPFTLSDDGTADDSYRPEFHWSPDSTRLVVMRVKPEQEHKVYFVESSPRDQVQPKLHEHQYLKPGDQIAHPRPRLFDIETKKPIPIPEDLFTNPWSIEDIRWSADSKRFTFLYNQRGHQTLRLVAVDAADGHASALIDEQSKTFIDYSNKTFVQWIEPTNEILWMSERDGWNHLWLYDAATGSVKNQVTRGKWLVRKVERVDEEHRQVWFWAGGIRPGQDPYDQHLARVNFDGSGLVVLTEGDGTHTVAFSPDRKTLIDTWSRVDQPPVTELRSADDGHLICALEKADASALLATGWRLPERFVAKGRDGQTDIFGTIVTPTNFDPSRKYPVVEEIYAGPQGAFVPKSWGLGGRQHELAELGFVVVQIDGMGTNWRSKAFHDVCWKNLADGGFPDRVLWIKAAAKDRPGMDLSRVGIYGGSAGGQNALAGLLTHPDFYKVGVADCGCHDNRMDKIWWNEAWMGWPVGPEYEANSNVTLARNLRGKLLLIVGEMDTNVDPASTMQVVNALIKADKDFDLLIVPGSNHGAAGSPYGHRRLVDFFVRNLLGVEPRS